MPENERPTVPETAVVCVFAFLLFALPFSQLLLGTDRGAVYQAVAGDTFYYLKLARSVVEHGFPSFDEVTLSNGYMPLWQLVVAFVAFAAGDTNQDPETLVLMVFYTSFALAAFGIVRLSAFLTANLGVRTALVAIVFLVPGAMFWFFQNSYWIAQSGGLHLGIHSWSFANGMESGVCLAIFSLIVPRLHRLSLAETVTARDAFILGGLCFLALMGRLDDVFLGVACGAFVLVVCWRQRSVRPFLAFACIPLLGSFAYLAGNYVTAGAPLPSSGTSKLSPLHNGLLLNDIRLIGLDDNVSSKFVPSLLGMTIGTLFLAHHLVFQRKGRRIGLLHVLSLYVLMKGAFVYFLVPLHATGLWYFTNLITAINLIVILVVGAALRPLLSPRVLTFVIPVFGLAGLASARNADLQLEMSRDDSFTTVYKQLCQDHDTLVSRLEQSAGTPLKIIDTTDGAYAYCLNLPAVGLTGLGDSRAFLADRERSSVFEAALIRGHDIVASSPVPVASYEWQSAMQAAGFDATLIFSQGLVDFWRLSRK